MRTHAILLSCFVAVGLFGCSDDASIPYIVPDIGGVGGDDGGRGGAGGGGNRDTGGTPIRDVGVSDPTDVGAALDTDAAVDLDVDAAPDDAAETSDAPLDGFDADADAPDALDALDGVADASPDIAPDVPEEDAARPVNCGDGRLDPGEECDDGNDINDDACSNFCTEAACGDAIINRTFGTEIFESPEVTNPFGDVGRVCDEGATCGPGSTCSIEDDHRAPEHGICQALGFDYATDITFGGGAGGGGAAVRVLDWFCWDFICRPGDFGGGGTSCETFEMLASISCAGTVGEECDDGALNSDEPDACRPDCTLPTCGDNVIDSEEQCDDGNRIDDDACRSNCRAAFCGDGVTSEVLGEECDDGNDNDDDGCTNTCEATLPPCIDDNIGSAVGAAVLTGVTSGVSRHGSCGASTSAPERIVGWVAPRSGTFTFDLSGSSYDTVLYARTDVDTATCTGRELACNDDAIGLQSRITVTVTAGEIILIFIDGFSSGSGSFVLNISG